MAFENIRYRAALRFDYDGEWFGEVATWVWSKLALGKSRQAARALYECERANRVELAQALKEAGAVVAPRNPLMIAPGVLGGIAAALTPLRVHRMVFTAGSTAKGLTRFYRARGRRFTPRADGLYEHLTQRHLDAFSTFKLTEL